MEHHFSGLVNYMAKGILQMSWRLLISWLWVTWKREITQGSWFNHTNPLKAGSFPKLVEEREVRETPSVERIWFALLVWRWREPHKKEQGNLWEQRVALAGLQSRNGNLSHTLIRNWVCHEFRSRSFPRAPRNTTKANATHSKEPSWLHPDISLPGPIANKWVLF